MNKLENKDIRRTVVLTGTRRVGKTTIHYQMIDALLKYVVAFYYQNSTSVGYYRGGKKDKEIDRVVAYPRIKNLLIEVKYREEAPIPDDSAICELCSEASVAIIVTKTQDDYGIHDDYDGTKMIHIPA